MFNNTNMKKIPNIIKTISKQVSRTMNIFCYRSGLEKINNTVHKQNKNTKKEKFINDMQFKIEKNTNELDLLLLNDKEYLSYKLYFKDEFSKDRLLILDITNKFHCNKKKLYFIFSEFDDKENNDIFVLDNIKHISKFLLKNKIILDDILYTFEKQYLDDLYGIDEILDIKLNLKSI